MNYNPKWGTINDNIKDVFAFFGDFWKYVKATWNCDGSTEYFDYLLECGNVLIKKYQGTNAKEISERIVYAYVKSVEDRTRR